MKSCKFLKFSLPTFFLVSGILAWFVLSDRSPEHVPVTERRAAQGQRPAIIVQEEPPTAPIAVPEDSVSSPAADFGAWAAEKYRQPDFTKIEAFDNWVARWEGATPEERPAMTEEGVRLASARRAEFKALIMTNPEEALARAVPRVVRQELPEEIVDLLERPVSATGDYDVYKGRPAPGTPKPEGGLTLRYFEAEGISYQAYVYGAMEPVMSRKQIPLRGVAVDRPLAVAESPLRQLEVGEKIPAGKRVEDVCPVSEETTEVVASDEAVSEDTPTVEVGERLITLCNGSHVTVLDEKYRVFVQASGPGSAGFFMESYPGTSSRAIGNFRCLYIRATYPDQMAPPNTEDQATDDMKNAARFFLENSFGKMTTTTTFTPLIVLPQTLKWYQDKDTEVNGLGVMQTQAREVARRLGYDSTQYDCIIVRVNGGLRSGASWGGGDSVWLGWGGMDVINHECGHSLGLGHANYWATTDGTAYGNGANQEYGNGFDVMGGGGGFNAHYNTTTKRRLGWLPDAYVNLPKSNGIFRLHAFDQARLEENKRYALNVAKDSNIQYQIEYHAYNPTLADQATVLYGNRLIDTTPGSAGGKNDGGIQIGRTYSDPEGDMHFTAVSKNATSPPSLDVAYFRGPFPENVAPVVALSVSSPVAGMGAPVTFTASASDANGDALAYHWEFDDGGTASNSNVVVRTFGSAAQITAMVTVSDMRGGTTRRHVVVDVGAHGKHRVSGQITSSGQPLANVRVSITSGKFCYTDADGNYVLSGVSTGSQRLTATLNGYAFTPFFNNPLMVVAGLNTANWTAAGSTFLTLTKTADAVEGGASGAFMLTRTGSTEADLVVRLSPVSGTAKLISDYTFSPNFVTDGNYQNFTIPAGQSSLVITVTAVNDTAQEGPETILLQTASNGNYLQVSSNVAVITVVDDDTTLPQVAVTAAYPYATEPSDIGSFLFTRTGSTAGPLSLSVTWTGVALNGTDYVSLPSSVTIPSGQSSVTVTVVPINDSAIEAPEDVMATISANAAYVRNNSAITATVTVGDDDTPVVSVTALDPTASEEEQDSGVFLIHRTGSTAAALKVYYGLSGSAFHGTDYMRLNGEVTIPAGAISCPVVITPYDDDLGEVTETVTLALSTFNHAYTLGTEFQTAVSILDNGDRPVISVRASGAGVEGGSNPSVIFRSLGSASGNVTVNFSVSGTATAGADYTALSGTVTLPASGPFDVSVPIPIINDNIAEPSETVNVTITPGTSYSVYNDSSAEAVIHDNDSGQRVMVTAFNSPASEGGTSVGKFYLSRPTTAGSLTVNYTLSGTATPGVDFAGLSGTAVIPDTASGVVVEFTPVDDSLGEGTETVTLNLVAAQGYSLDRPSSATVEIIDNDATSVTVGFQAALSATSEIPGANGEFRDIPLILSAASSSPVTVQCVGASGSSAFGDDVDWAFVDATNGTIVPTATVTFAAGATTASVRIRVKNDGVSEGSETAVLELRAPFRATLTSGRNRHSLSIFDDVVPNLVTEERWNNTSVYANQTWGASLPNSSGFLTSFTPAQGIGDNFSRRMIGQIVAPVTGSYTFWVAADDAARLYLSTTSSSANKALIASISTWVDFQAWDTRTSQKSAAINLVGGQSYYMEVQQQEGGGGDHISVAWQGPGFSRTPVAVEVPDNAPRKMRMATKATTRSEADGSDPLLMVILDRPAGTMPVTVSYVVGGTATAGVDYLLTPGTLTFAPGEQVKRLPLSILLDDVGEATETIVVSLSNPVGATLAELNSHTITLSDLGAPTVPMQQFSATSAMNAGTLLGTLTADLVEGRSLSGWSIVSGDDGSLLGVDSNGAIRLLQPALLPNPGTRQLVVRVTDSAGSTGDGTVNLLCNPPATPGVVERRWSGSTAYNNQAWTGTPDYSGTLATFTTPRDVAENYSRRMTGYLQPEVSGEYNFWIASDDNSRLFLSSDASEANRVQIATVSGWVNFQSWDSQTSQRSAAVFLEAGKVYWLEVHHLEGGGGDHVSVAWSGPGISRTPITAGGLFPNFGTNAAAPLITLTSPAAGTLYTSGSTVRMEASVAGGSQEITAVEFYSGGTVIAADVAAPYSAEWVDVPIGNFSLTAKAIYNGGSVTSLGIGITVNPMNRPPVFANNSMDGGSVLAGVAYAGNLASFASDPDAASGDKLTFAKVSGPNWLVVAANGALSGTPAIADFGPNRFVVRVTDAGNLSAEAMLDVSVKAPETVKSDNTSALNVTSSWVGGVVPGSGSVAVWNHVVASANTVGLGANTNWGGVRIDDPGGDVTINGTPTLAAGAVDIGTLRNLTFSNTNTSTVSSLAGSTTLTVSRASSNNWTSSLNSTNALRFDGTLALRGGNATTSSSSIGLHWLAFGGANLTQQAGTAFVLDTGVSTTNAGDFIMTDAWNNESLRISGLRGFGTIRTDWGTFNAVTRTLRVSQLVNTTFNGLFLAHNNRSLVFQKAGEGTLTMAGRIGVQAGTPRVDLAVEAGTLVLAAENGRVNAADATTISSGATLQLGNGGTTGTLGTGNSVVNFGTLALNRSNTLLVANVISGGGQVQHIGSGTSVLSASHTYSGATTIFGGRLELTGSLAAESDVKVEAGGTFSGTGSAPGAVTVSGRLAPGTSGPGTLKVGALTLADGAKLAWDLDTASDLVNALSLDFTGDPTIHLHLTGPDPAAPGDKRVVPLIATTGGVTGFSNSTFIIHNDSLGAESTSFEVKVQGDSLVLSIAPFVPPLSEWEIWQQERFGDQAGNPDIAGPNADPDGDGVGNFSEMHLGLDPKDQNSRLQLSISSLSSNSQFTLRVSPVVTAGSFVIETSDSPGGSWLSEPPLAIEADAAFLSVSISPISSRKFYRLRYTPPSFP